MSMHTSDQASDEQQPHHVQAPDTISGGRDVYSSETINNSNITKTPGEASDEIKDQQGWSYPPLPSFYENQPEVKHAATPAIQTQWPGVEYRSPSAPSQLSAGDQASVYTFGNIYSAGSYVGQPPYSSQARRTPKKWLWILLGTLSIILLGSCGVCAWAGFSLFNSSYKQVYSIVVDGQNQVNDYYGDLINKQYGEAYQILSPQGSMKGLNEQQFTQEEIEQENRYGSVYRYTPQSPTDFNGTTNITQFTQKVDVERGKRTYTVTLILRKIGNQWKIVHFDQL